MASERQIAANRRNATHSTGPRTHQGKKISKRNALRHGLTAETVIAGVEVESDYRSLEQQIMIEFTPVTAMEFELVARLASLTWRLRRASRIETGLFELQNSSNKEFLDEKGKRDQALRPFYEILRKSKTIAISQSGEPGLQEWDETQTTQIAKRYLQLCALPAVTKRLGRYEASLWRQLAQILMMLDTAKNFRLRVNTTYQK